MNYGFWWWSKMSGVIWHHRSNGQFTLISILARSVKTTGFETVFKKLRSNKKRSNSQRIVQTCLNHYHGRKCYRRLHGRRFTWQVTAEWGEIFSLPILVKISSTSAPFWTNSFWPFQSCRLKTAIHIASWWINTLFKSYNHYFSWGFDSTVRLSGVNLSRITCKAQGVPTLLIHITF